MEKSLVPGIYRKIVAPSTEIEMTAYQASSKPGVWEAVNLCGLKSPLILIEKMCQGHWTQVPDRLFENVKKSLRVGSCSNRMTGSSYTAKRVQKRWQENFDPFWSKEFWPLPLQILIPWALQYSSFRREKCRKEGLENLTASNNPSRLIGCFKSGGCVCQLYWHHSQCLFAQIEVILNENLCTCTWSNEYRNW